MRVFANLQKPTRAFPGGMGYARLLLDNKAVSANYTSGGHLFASLLARYKEILILKYIKHLANSWLDALCKTSGFKFKHIFSQN
jgi:hypothetical protein